tara:strand:- start:117 stop:743 length:627 start_codon:yes stop_codon:yes gene_type:complete
MQINTRYLEASFISFVIHALIIVYLFGFFYFEKIDRSILSNPINVNLLFEQKQTKPVPKELNSDIAVDKTNDQSTPLIQETILNEISFEKSVNISDIQDLLNEDTLLQDKSDQDKIDLYSSMIISNIQSAWRKPINIQEGLECVMRLTINKNGRIIKVNLIQSSGNIRFDNSALKAVERLETFNFFESISVSLYQTNFKNIQIKFNPS